MYVPCFVAVVSVVASFGDERELVALLYLPDDVMCFSILCLFHAVP